MITSYTNGTAWADITGDPIQAHGGYIISHDGYYYWYGENRMGANYVSCYRSRDLLNWEFRNNILTKNSKTEATRVVANLSLVNGKGTKVNIERPKVLYNKLTGKFVMWAHYENGLDYYDACACVASCDTPDGDFTYHGSFRPFGEMSRDCTLFLDDDGTAYFITASRGNLDTRVYRLAPDFLNCDKHCATLWQSEMREAPAMFKKDGEYFMINSFCTGRHPNQGKYSRSKDISDGWKMLDNFGDRWCYKNEGLMVDETDVLAYYRHSTYVVFEIQFDADGNPFIEWNPDFTA